jgi:hypothetical protein
MPDAVMRFRGRLVPHSFCDFARHRAARLALRVIALEADAHGASAWLEGPPALLDAFETACSLGPIDCLVTSVEREAA